MAEWGIMRDSKQKRAQQTEWPLTKNTGVADHAHTSATGGGDYPWADFVAADVTYLQALVADILQPNLVDKSAAEAIAGTWQFANTGLTLLDSNGSHVLTIKPGSDLTANRTLTITTGDSDRTITLTGNPTLADWFDQAVKIASSPTHAGLTLSTSGKLLLRDSAIGVYSQADTFLDLFADGAIRIGDSSAGAPTNYVEIGPAGDIDFIAGAGLAFGGISVSGGAVNTTLNSAAKVQITTFTTDDPSNGVVVPDQAGNEIGVPAGMYMVTISITADNKAGAGHVIEVGLYNAGGSAAYANVHSHRTLGAGASIGSMTLSGLIDVTAATDLELWADTDRASNTAVLFSDITMSVVKVAGT